MENVKNIFADYKQSLNEKYKTGEAREHAYRTPLEQLLSCVLGKEYIIINEPSRKECGSPDMTITNKKSGMVVTTFETKDLNKGDLDGTGKNQEQFDRYKRSLGHVVFTDYLDFHFFENDNKLKEIRIGRIENHEIIFDEEQCQLLATYLKEFVCKGISPISSSITLAGLMAMKARLMASIIVDILKDKHNNSEKGYLLHFYNEIKESLIQNLDEEQFAKIYSQTVAYGLFAARLNDKTPENFSRGEAAELIPKTNMFLRGIFNDLAGNNIHTRIAWIVDDLVRMFGATDLQQIFKRQMKSKRDPLIHFYEDFLRAFDPKDKKNFGVWYTPQEVVKFIVASIDTLLKEKFDTSNPQLRA